MFSITYHNMQSIIHFSFAFFATDLYERHFLQRNKYQKKTERADRVK